MMIKELNDIIKMHDRWRSNCINLTPSENALSPMVKEALQTDMGQRYYFENSYMAKNGASYSYHGTAHIAALIREGQELAREIFEVEFASLYPISGHMAVIGAVAAVYRDGGTILVYDPSYGGYPGLDKNKMPKYLGFNVEYMPVISDFPETIDLIALKHLVNRAQPVAIVLSSAHTIFPYPLEEIKSICGNECVLIYDASHPLGLIAGKQFQNPIREGADIIVGGTQKSFPGPQGGIILTNEYIDQIKKVEHFVLVDNPHFHRIAALTIALSEMKDYGEHYALQVVKNTKKLAAGLFEIGLPVKYRELGFSESHMFKMDIFDGYDELSCRLEQANIIIDKAGRIGTNEMTRMGMKESDMLQIAKFIGRVFLSNEDPSVLKRDIIEFRKSFQQAEFCFEEFPEEVNELALSPQLVPSVTVV